MQFVYITYCNLEEQKVRHAISNFCKVQNKELKMSGVQASVDSMLNQCLAFSRDMASRNQSFTFSFTTINFNFKLNTMNERKPYTMEIEKKKKVSPSTLRRNARRRKYFLQRKAEAAATEQSESDNENDKETSQVTINSNSYFFKCDQCDKTFETNKGLKIHIGKAHKTDSDFEILRDNESQRQLSLTLTPPKGGGDKSSCLDSTHLDEVVSDESSTTSEEPFELKFNKLEHRHCYEIRPEWLEKPLPNPLPHRVMHPTKGLGVYQGVEFGQESYRFKDERSCCTIKYLEPKK